MDNQSVNMYPRKSGSVDDILNRYDAKDSPSAMRVIHSDTEEGVIEDSKNKAEAMESNQLLVLQNSVEYKFPMIKNKLPPARLSNVQEKHVPQSDADELNAIGVEGLDGKYSLRSYFNDEKHKVETVIGNVNAHRVSERVTQSEVHESKARHKKFLASLVMKDSKIFDGSHKLEKSTKKMKEIVKQRTTVHSGTDEKETQKLKHEQMLEYRTAKGNSYGGANKTMSWEEKLCTHVLKTKEARKGKGGKKKQDEESAGGVSNEQASVAQKDKTATGMEESDSKRKRGRMGFLTKMLKKGKKADGHHDAVNRVDVGEADEAADDGGTPDVPASVQYRHLSETQEPSADLKAEERIPRVNFGLKLFPGDDGEFKKKLESRMARIESEMNETAVSQKAETVDGTLSAPPEHKMNQTSSSEGSVHKMMDGEDMCVGHVLPPPLLPRRGPTLSGGPPPRLIKLTPPTPPICDAPSTQPFDDPSSPIGKEFLNCMASNGFPSSKVSSEPINCAKSDEEIIMRSKDTYEYMDDGFKGPTATAAISETPMTSNDFIAGVEVSDVNGEILNAAMKTCDGNLYMGFDLSYHGGCKSGLQNPQETQGKCKNSDRGDEKFSPDGSDSYLQLVSPSDIETFQRPGSHIDELSLLLNELDRINSSPLQQEDISSNRRPASEEIKRVSTFEEDFVNAFPIRRRRNSDPDYDIPRPHRIPSLQAMKEESHAGGMPPSAQPSDNNTSNRENADSIVIEATRFFGPGMDFSFDDHKYTCLKHSGDLWGFQGDNKNPAVDCTHSFSFTNCGSNKYKEQKNDDRLLANENVGIKETSECDVHEINVGEMNVSEMNVSEMNVSEMNDSEMNDSEMNDSEIPINEAQNEPEQLPSVVEHCDDCVLRFGNELKGTVEIEKRDVTMRNSNIDRVCRKERSREVYEIDLNDQLKLNNIMEGISISSTLTPADVPKNDSEENSESETAVEKDSSKGHQDEIVDPGQVCEASSEFCDLRVLEVEEHHLENIATSPETMPKNASRVRTLPKYEYDTVPAIEAKDDAFCLENGADSDLMLHLKPKDSSVEKNESFRLSFATTETLLVEEEVLVATLKTTTTTTACLPSATDDLEPVEKVEELVEEVTLDVDQLSDDQFDSIQVQSCVQT